MLPREEYTSLNETTFYRKETSMFITLCLLAALFGYTTYLGISKAALAAYDKIESNKPTK